VRRAINACALRLPGPSFTRVGSKQKVQGGWLAFIGFMLSPLSWWNDAFVNLPLAAGFAWLVARIHPAAFSPALIIGYWLTNILGFVLMHKGAKKLLNREEKPYSRRDFAKDIGVSLLYNLLIVVLVQLRILRPIGNYFAEK
jgi:hypothetical protein